MEKSKTHIVEEDTITINLQNYITPISIILSAIIVASSILIGLNNLGVALKGTTTTNTANTTTTTTQQGSNVSKDSIANLINDSRNIKFGDSSKAVLIAEFSDPSCPYCHIAGGSNPELNKQAGGQFLLEQDGGTYRAPVKEFKKLVDQGKASYVWLYTNGHGNGRLASEAMYCAHEQGKFWEVHDLLYSSAGYTTVNDVVQNDRAKVAQLADFLASAIDKTFLQNCLNSAKYESKLSEDEQTASTLAVSGTPGFFINETRFAGAYSFSEMESVVNSALGI